MRVTRYALATALGLLPLLVPGSLRADDFTFSFTNTSGFTAGTVTGEIIGLTDNATGAASEVILTSYPDFYLNDPVLSAPPVDVSSWTYQIYNNFTEANGAVTSALFYAQSSDLDTPQLAFGTPDTANEAFLADDNPLNYYNDVLTGGDQITFSPLATPEPSTGWLMLIGLGFSVFMLVMRKSEGPGLAEAA